MPAHDRIGKQFLLVDDAKLKWQERIESRYVERGSMIDGVDGRLRCVDLLHSNHLEGRKNRFHHQLRPGAGESMQGAAILIEKAERYRRSAQGDGVKPDQQIEEQVGTQPAEQAVLALRRLGTLIARLGDWSNSHAAIFHQPTLQAPA